MNDFITFLGHGIPGTRTCLQAFADDMAPATTYVKDQKGYERWIEQHNHHAQVYIGINPIRKDAGKFPKDADVAFWCNEYLDLDCEKPKEFKGYNATDGELEHLKPFVEKINNWLNGHGFNPGYCDMTGNGYRWILPVPPLMLIGKDLSVLATKKKAFKERISKDCEIVPGSGAAIDSVFDFKRITGVPGTENVKTESADRPCRTREPFRGVERQEDQNLRDYIMLLEIEAPAPIAAPPRPKDGTLEELMKKDPKLKQLLAGDVCEHTSRSEAELALACKLVLHGFPDVEIGDILADVPGSKAAEKRTAGHENYITKTVAKAVSWTTPRTEHSQNSGDGTVSPDTFLVGDKQAFDTNGFAKWLLNKSGERFVTLTDNDRIYRYSDGVYVPSGETFIKKSVEQVMDGFKVTTHGVNEVITHIRRRTYTERDNFDNDIDIINMRNGLYHIKSREFEQHTPDYLSLSKMDVKYDPDAECKEMDRFINDVVEPHRVDAIYEIAGYSVLPEKRLKRGVIFVGEPDTGKSTMIDVICAFVGEKRISDVSPVDFGDDNHASFDLYGMFLNRIDDLGTTPIMNTGVLKSIISSAPIRANQKYGAPFSFVPNAMILFGCNQVPICTDANLRDKFDILMFKNVHSGENIDLDMPKKLTTDKEMSGLFNKAMLAVKTAIENRTFTGSYTLYDRQKDYEYHSNPFARFVDECCDLSNQEMITDKKLFRKIYVEWSKQHDFTIVTVGAQTTYLQDKGVILRRLGSRDDRNETYVGIDIMGDVGRCHKCPKPVSQEKPTFFQEQEADSKNGVMCHSPTLRDRESTVKERMGCDTRHHQENDSRIPNHDLTPTQHTCDTSQSEQMKTIDIFFRQHKDVDNKPAEVTYASQKQLVEFVPEIATLLQVNKDVAFRLVMEYGKDRGWI